MGFHLLLSSFLSANINISGQAPVFFSLSLLISPALNFLHQSLLHYLSTNRNYGLISCHSFLFGICYFLHTSWPVACRQLWKLFRRLFKLKVCSFSSERCKSIKIHSRVMAPSYLKAGLLALASSSIVHGHTVFTNFFVDGKDQVSLIAILCYACFLPESDQTRFTGQRHLRALIHRREADELACHRCEQQRNGLQ